MSFRKPAGDPGTRRQRSRVPGIGCATRHHIRPLAARPDYSRCPPAGPARPAGRPPFAEVGRLVCPGGLFLFHVNALEDRPLRARWQPARELEADYVAEESGQTMHFFSEAYLRELLGDGGRCSWSRSRFRIARRVGCSSMSGGE